MIAYQRAFVVRGVDVNRDAEILEVLGHLPEPLDPSDQRISWETLFRYAQRILHSGVTAYDLGTERQGLDPTCEPTVDHVAASESIVYQLAYPPSHHQ